MDKWKSAEKGIIRPLFDGSTQVGWTVYAPGGIDREIGRLGMVANPAEAVRRMPPVSGGGGR